MVSGAAALVSNGRLAHQDYEVLVGDWVQQIGHWSFLIWVAFKRLVQWYRSASENDSRQFSRGYRAAPKT